MSSLTLLPNEIVAMILSYFSCQKVELLLKYRIISTRQLCDRGFCNYKNITEPPLEMIAQKHYICLDQCKYKIVPLLRKHAKEYDFMATLFATEQKKMFYYFMADYKDNVSRMAHLLTGVLRNDGIELFKFLFPMLHDVDICLCSSYNGTRIKEFLCMDYDDILCCYPTPGYKLHAATRTGSKYNDDGYLVFYNV